MSNSKQYKFGLKSNISSLVMKTRRNLLVYIFIYIFPSENYMYQLHSIFENLFRYRKDCMFQVVGQYGNQMVFFIHTGQVLKGHYSSFVHLSTQQNTDTTTSHSHSCGWQKSAIVHISSQYVSSSMSVIVNEFIYGLNIISLLSISNSLTFK